jgi:bifunctional non-homologous end joining protein LigD
MPLIDYDKKRNFGVTPEPAGKVVAKAKHAPLIYVIQKHRATALHYDFRIEWKGVLLSWAVPKGPALDPTVRRLAMQVEDHPIDYATFEGVIPEGEYGGGTVMVWDQGTWTPEQEDVDAALAKGDLKMMLHGKKLKGSWVLVRTRGYGRDDGKSWLLIKHRDEYASTEDITLDKPRSVVSNRLLAGIAKEGGGDIAKATTGDPPAAGKSPASAPAPKAAGKSPAKVTAKTPTRRAASAAKSGKSGAASKRPKSKAK